MRMVKVELIWLVASLVVAVTSLGVSYACADASAAVPCRAEGAAPLTASGLPVFESAALIYTTQHLDACTGRVNFVPWRTPDQVMARIAAGQVDFAILPTNQPALLASHGVPVRVLRVLSSRDNLAVLSTRKASDLSAALRGATVAAPFPHGYPALILRELLHGLELSTPQDVALNFVENPLDALSLLRSQRADAAFLAEPLVSAAELQSSTSSLTRYPIDTLWQKVQPSVPLVVGVLAALGPTADNASLAERVARSFDAALTTLRADPDVGVQALTRQFPQLSAEAVRRGLARVQIEGLASGQGCRAWLDFLGFLAKHDPALVGGKLPQPSLCAAP